MRRALWGIDVSEEGVRAARVDVGAGTLGETAQTGQERTPLSSEAAREFLLGLPAEREAVVSFPPAWSACRFIELPPMKKSQHEAAIRARIKKFLEFRESEHVLSYRESTARRGEKSRRGYFVTLVRRNALEGALPHLAACNLSVRRVEIPHAALLRWACWERPDLKRGTHMLAHFLDREVLLLAWCDGDLVYTRTLRPPLASLLSWKQGHLPDTSDIAPLCEHLARELLASITHVRFRLTDLELHPAQLLLTGLNSLNQDLVRFLGRRVGVAVVSMSEHRLVSREETENATAHQKWVLAAGLSLRALEESAWIR